MKQLVMLFGILFTLAVFTQGCESGKKTVSQEKKQEETAEKSAPEQQEAPAVSAPATQVPEESPAEESKESGEEAAGEMQEASGAGGGESEKPAAEGAGEIASLAAGGALPAPDASPGKAENEKGIEHFKEGHWDVAEKHFKGAIEADPNLAEAHYNLALALDKLGNHGDATNHFRKALELAGDNPKIKDSQILKDHLKS